MPIRIDDKLPAAKTLENENIFFMTENRATHQDIRPLKIAILNLMPTKIVTETQLLRLLGNTPLQVDVDLIKTKTYVSKNTSQDHLLTFYKTFDQIKNCKFDGLVITGAPVELMEFEEVDYWQELCEILEWTKTNVTSTFHICWGAQAGLYYHYGIKKYTLPSKVFGIYEHIVLNPRKMLLRGFDDTFFAPHSRWTSIDEDAVKNCPHLEVIAASPLAGTYIITSRGGKHIFVSGHSEYDGETLGNEYKRDIAKGIDIAIPHNYFVDDDPSKPLKVSWRSHANLLFSNWLNYHVYQATPYDINEIQ